MKATSVALLAVIVALFLAGPLLAQGNVSGTLNPDTKAPYPGDRGAQMFYGNALAAGLGAAITLVGAGWGFGRIGAAALESMARQPETAGKVQTAMLIIAALLEGATFFSLIVCILMAVKA